VALVTGASRGIGAEVLRSLVGAGWTVYLNHRDSQVQATALVQSLGPDANVTIVQADVVDADAVATMVDQIRDAEGRLDSLIHNAGVPLEPRRVAKLDWERDVAGPLHVAARGFLNCFQTARSLLSDDARVVVVLTSALLEQAPAQMGAYLVAKGALWGLVRAVAAELRGSDQTAFAVSPGMTNTELLAAYGSRALELISQDLPGGTLGDPAEVGRAIARLVIDPPTDIHGHNVRVPSGMGGA